MTITRERTWVLQHRQGVTTLLVQRTTLGARVLDRLIGAVVYLEARSWPWRIGTTNHSFGNVLFSAANALVASVDRRTRTVAEFPADHDLVTRLHPEFAELLATPEVDRG